MAKKLPNDLKYRVDDKYVNYGSWDYTNNLPQYDANLFALVIKNYGWAYAKKKNWDANTRVKNYFSAIKYLTDEFKELSIQFDKHLVDNPWIREYYDFCLKATTYVTDPFDPEGHWVSLTGHYSQPEDRARTEKALKFFNEPLNFQRFNLICKNDSQLLCYNEIKRDVPYVVGNIVRLRKKYIGSRNHDPFYSSRELKDEDRIGYITAILNDTHSNSYNGKGSRLVEVHWQASGKRNNQSIGSLKLLDQKNNKLVDKLVDE